MPNNLVLSVTQLNEYLHSLVQVDPLLRSLSLRGEISNFKRHSSGHLYFSMKDNASVIRCVMFRQNALGLRLAPRDGMQVEARGYVSHYVRDGQLQFYCEGLKADGVGALYQLLEQLKRRLAQEGCFDPAHKRPLPALPRRIGVVTSPTGAVIRDIIRVAKRRNPGVDILLYPARVQGEGAAQEIAQGVAALNQRDVDVLIVGRGGGSWEDLWAFNEEEVVRAVYQSAVPVVSAVGHETDFTLCDLAADARASTPSNAAEMAVLDVADVLLRLDGLQTRLRQGADRALEKRRAALDRLRLRPALRQPDRWLAQRLDQVAPLRKRLDRALAGQLQARRQALLALTDRLCSLDPRQVLRRGYALLRAGERPVTRIAQAELGQALTVRLWDGALQTTIVGVERHEETEL